MLNPVEEAKFADLRRMCKDLGVPAPPEIMILLQVRDREGRLILEDKQRGHSWTRNFYNSLIKQIAGAPGTSDVFGAGYLCNKRTNGVLLEVPNTYGNLANIYIAGALGIARGLVVGTGTGAASPENYALGALIAHGTGAGQLSYAAYTASVAAYTAGTKTWKVTHARIFNNNSSGTIIVGETGFGYEEYYTWLIERSVLAPTVTVVAGAQLTVTYEISMDFSAID